MQNTKETHIPNAKQINQALEDIAHMAAALQSVCDRVIQGDEEGDLIVAAEHLAAKIGWTADRCLGFDVKSSDSWLMPYRWAQVAEKTNQAAEQ